MLYFVIGLPGRFTEWCDAAAAELVRRALGPAELIRADALADISMAMIRTGAGRAVIASRQPGGRLRSALVEAGQPFVVALEHPHIALAETVRSGSDLAVAVQLVAGSCAGIERFASAPRALALFRDRIADDPIGIARKIADHLALPISDAGIVDVVHELTAAGLMLPGSAESSEWVGPAEEEERIVRGALGPFLAHRSTGELPPVIWEPELFFVGDRPNERVTGPIDLTGRARCLLHGPYIMLPPGLWSLSLRLAFSREALEYDFMIEVVANRQIACSTIRPHNEGVLEANLGFTLEAETDHPIGIRLSTQRAAFDGAVALVRAILLPDWATLEGRPSAVGSIAGASVPGR
jgi:hypothetical protein